MSSFRLFKAQFLSLMIAGSVYFIPYLLSDKYFYSIISSLNFYIQGRVIDLGTPIKVFFTFCWGMFCLLNISALFILIDGIRKNEKTAIAGAYRKAFLKRKALLGVLFLYYIKVFLWSFLFVIPGIVMGIKYSLSLLIASLEDKRGIQALFSSRKIVEYDFNKYLDSLLFGVLAIIAIIAPFILVLKTVVAMFVAQNMIWQANAIDLVQAFIVVCGIVLFQVFSHDLYVFLKTAQERKNDETS
ncbi:MAG: hypothetical protein HQL27_09010 [Candidatus Omnitrophica bacterium]|nr:hypothetical protein [Candidatus Omnitrophota bacterium]